MKLVSYLKEGHDQVAILVDGMLFEAETLHPDLPNTMSVFLDYWEDVFPLALGGEIMIREGKISKDKGIDPEEVFIVAPVPFPNSCRDGYAFREHVAAARRNRKVD